MKKRFIMKIGGFCGLGLRSVCRLLKTALGFGFNHSRSICLIGHFSLSENDIVTVKCPLSRYPYPRWLIFNYVEFLK